MKYLSKEDEQHVAEDFQGPPASEPTVRSSALLADLVAKYLASDGSSGLFDARTMRATREEIMKIIPAAKVRLEKEKIVRGLVG